VTTLRYMQALNQTLMQEMERDGRYVYMGEDVRFAIRGVAKGLVERFGPERVVDCPISEQAFTGVATGLAMAGFRPIVEYQITALIYVAFDQLVDQAQKLSLITGGQTSVPVTYLMAGSGWRPGIAGQHADNPYALLVHAGMKTGVPVTASDAAGMLKTALEDPDPVMLFLPAAAMAGRGEVEPGFPPVELGRGRIVRRGTDVTLCAIGAMVAVAEQAAREVEADGISVEVMDPRWVLPFDYALLGESVQGTGRLVVCDDASRSCGVASEVVAYAAESLSHSLRGPVQRVTRPDIPVPFGASLERAVIPSVEMLAGVLRRLVAS